jgi:hypothetical protein
MRDTVGITTFRATTKTFFLDDALSSGFRSAVEYCASLKCFADFPYTVRLHATVISCQLPLSVARDGR